MVKVLFIVPDNSQGSYQALANSYSAIEPPTWALMLAESCRSRSAEVEILDCLPLCLCPDRAAEYVLESKPHIVCFVVYGQNPNASSVNMHGVVAYSEAVSKLIPDQFTLVIGPHVAALPYQTLRLHKTINAVSINEGVYTLHDLIQVYESKQGFNDEDLSRVRGLVFRTSDSSSIANGAPGEIVTQTNIERDLPGYAWDLLPYKEKPLDLYRSHLWHAEYDPAKATPFAAIYTSFGCIFKCSFCMINIINKTDFNETLSSSDLNSMRFLPLSIIRKSLDFFAENGVKNVRICDEMFFLNQNHYESILGYITDCGYDFNMWAYARVDTIKRSQLDLFKRAGVNWLGVGIESGSSLIRGESIKGDFSINKIINVIHSTQNSGISVGSNFIVGMPKDNRETCKETGDLAKELATEFINIYPCIDLPGSQIHTNANRPEDANYLKYGFLSYYTIPNGTEFLTPAEVLQTRDQLWQEIYSSPSVMNTLKVRFGPVAVDTINKLKGVKLSRKLLGDTLS